MTLQWLSVLTQARRRLIRVFSRHGFKVSRRESIVRLMALRLMSQRVTVDSRRKNGAEVNKRPGFIRRIADSLLDLHG